MKKWMTYFDKLLNEGHATITYREFNHYSLKNIVKIIHFT